MAAVGSAMAVVVAAKKKREDEEKRKAAAAAMFNKQQIALEEYRAWKAALAKLEAEQAAAPAEAEQTIEFFFGEPLSSWVREQKLTVVPECTGIWWRQF